MDETATLQTQLCQQAFRAENSGRLRAAAEDYRRALLLDRTNPTPYLYLAYVLNKMGEKDAAVKVYSLAADMNPNVVNAWRNPELSEDIQLRSREANDQIRRHFTALHRQAVADYQRREGGAQLDRIFEAVWCATHDQPVTFREQQQRPHLFYVPGLEPTSLFDGSLYPWCQTLEAAWEVIRDEYLALSASPEVSGVPYIDANAGALDDSWKPLIGSDNWTSLHLYRNDEQNRLLIALTPQTGALLKQVPLLKTSNQPREVLFSVLKGGQHIPPHYGLANTDMTVHLPLITSNQAGIKVAGVEHQWQEGKAFLFDDSFLHESWNESTEPRVNLLFGAWHPDLSIDEQNAISASFEYREAWNRTRSI